MTIVFPVILRRQTSFCCFHSVGTLPSCRHLYKDIWGFICNSLLGKVRNSIQAGCLLVFYFGTSSLSSSGVISAISSFSSFTISKLQFCCCGNSSTQCFAITSGIWGKTLHSFFCRFMTTLYGVPHGSVSTVSSSSV